MEELSRTGGSQTVIRALTLLKCFSSDDSHRSLTELSKATGLTVPTTRRLLRTLAARKFLTVNSKTKLYSLGPAIMPLAGSMTASNSLLVEMLPKLELLRRESGESAGLHALVDLNRVCLIEMVSHHPMRMSSGVGRVYSLHKGAAGRIILAFLPESERRECLMLDHKEPNEAYIEATEADLAHCREAGFATSCSEVVAGATAVAAVIRDATGYPVAAVNVTGPTERWTLSRATDFAPRISSAIADVERKLGHVLEI